MGGNSSDADLVNPCTLRFHLEEKTNKEVPDEEDLVDQPEQQVQHNVGLQRGPVHYVDEILLFDDEVDYLTWERRRCYKKRERKHSTRMAKIPFLSVD